MEKANSPDFGSLQRDNNRHESDRNRVGLARLRHAIDFRSLSFNTLLLLARYVFFASRRVAPRRTAPDQTATGTRWSATVWRAS
ncbi:MAG: hypothetical protein L6435_04265, partial [Anaerolineae bacterium]|nr:hypothetical protein [Anaerolineae bacterium]